MVPPPARFKAINSGGEWSEWMEGEEGGVVNSTGTHLTRAKYRVNSCMTNVNWVSSLSEQWIEKAGKLEEKGLPREWVVFHHIPSSGKTMSWETIIFWKLQNIYFHSFIYLFVYWFIRMKIKMMDLDSVMWQDDEEVLKLYDSRRNLGQITIPIYF